MNKIIFAAVLALAPVAASAQEAPAPIISTQAAPSIVGLGGLGTVGTIVVATVVVGTIAAVVSDEGSSGTSGSPSGS